MPSVTGAPFPECFENAEPKFGRDWAADLAQQHNAEARVKVILDRTTDATDVEFAQAMARADADTVQNDINLNQLKVRTLENTVVALKKVVELQRNALAKHRPVTDEKPVISCYSEMREIVKTLTDGINNHDADYKDLCLRITLRSVRDLVDVLCEKTDNSGGAVIGDIARRLLDNVIERIKHDEEPPHSLAEPEVVSAWVKKEIDKCQRKNDDIGVNAFKHLQNRMEAEPKPVANGGAGEPRRGPPVPHFPTRYWLHVPFDLKDDAKRLGAQWDSEKRKWFASKQDGKLFKQFEPVFIKCSFGANVDDLRNEGATWNRDLKRWVCHRGSNAWHNKEDYFKDDDLDWMDLVD